MLLHYRTRGGGVKSIETEHLKFKRTLKPKMKLFNSDCYHFAGGDSKLVLARKTNNSFVDIKFIDEISKVKLLFLFPDSFFVSEFQ